MLDKITKPTLLIKKDVAIKNIQKIIDKTKEKGIIFRPHFKTHQSAEIGKWFKEEGIDKITVSSLEMAEYFVKNGWKDITVAFPVNTREITTINKLAKKITLNLLVVNRESAIFLDENLKTKVNIFIKINVGADRTGLIPDEFHYIADLVLFIQESKRLEFQGILTHAGHTYSANSFEEIEEIHYEQLKIMKDVKKSLGHQFEETIISIGDTPTCSLMNDFFGIDEIRPGNFVFYDLMQEQIGSCNFDDIAICLAAPVVAKHSERNEVVVYGGAIHLSKEHFLINNNKSFGSPVYLSDEGWSGKLQDGNVRALSQEHGIIQVNAEDFEKIKIGDLLGIIPVHSCLTMNLMRDFVVV